MLGAFPDGADVGWEMLLRIIVVAVWFIVKKLYST